MNLKILQISNKQKSFIKNKSDYLMLLSNFGVLFILLMVTLKKYLTTSYFHLNLFFALFITIFLVVYIYKIIIDKAELRLYENSQPVWSLYNKLQKFIQSYNSNIKLVVDLSGKEYNASANSKKRTIILNKKWFDDGFKEDIKKEYLKCTLLHELYHIKSNKSVKENFLERLAPICPIKNIRKKLIIDSWIEELSADRYAYEQYENTDIFMECMLFKKGTNKKDKSCATHSSWDVRYKFIKENIPVTYQNVEKEYKLWKRKNI